MKERKIISLLLSAGLLCSVPQVMAATVVRVDPSAGSSTQVGRANNGVTQVDIATPSSKGVSVNQYSQFDIDKQGVILNNSSKDTRTTLAGWITGNKNLSQGGAKVIVNQVNSDNPSQLNGYIEVAGSKADVIIANPSGISVNGGGFLNAGNVTLTTGKPVIKDGVVNGYDVRKGQIDVGAKGLDGSQADYTQLLSKTARIQGKIAAKELKVVVGSNKLDKNGNVVETYKDEPVSEVGIDSSALGGMYAQRITIISTDNGAGVNLNGQTYTNDNLVLDAHGDVNHAGQLLSQGDVQIKTTGHVQNTGVIGASKHIAIQAGTDLSNGVASATGHDTPREAMEDAFELHDDEQPADAKNPALSQDLFKKTATQQGTIYAGQGIDINTKGQLINQDSGLVWSDTDLDVQTGDRLHNTGAIVGSHQVNIQSQSGVDNNGLIFGGQSVHLSAANDVSLQQGVIAANQDLAISSAQLFNDHSLITGGQVNLTTRGDLNNRNRGRINANQDLIINAVGGEVQNDGTITSKNNIALFADHDIVNNGQITADDTLSLATAGNLYNGGPNHALLRGTQQLYIRAYGNVENDVTSEITSNLVNIDNQGVFDNQGQVVAQDLVGIHSHGALNNHESGVISAALVNLATDQDFYNAGLISSQKGSGILIAADGDTRNTGHIVTDQKLSISAHDIDNAGVLQGDQGVSLNATGDIDNTGSIASKGDIWLKATNSVSNKGDISTEQVVHVLSKTFEYGGQVNGHLRVSGGQVQPLKPNSSDQPAHLNNSLTINSPNQPILEPQVMLPLNHQSISVANGGLTGSESQTIGEVEKNAQRKDSIQSLLRNLDTRPYHNAAGNRYLIEADKQYTDRQEMLSSDYMLQRLSINPSQVMMRLGDGHFEQALVREQFQSMFGEDLFATQYRNMNYRTLMDNGVHYAQANHIQIGTPLTAAQQKDLKQDIVWLVRDKVYLPGGNHFVQVLYPRVYFAN